MNKELSIENILRESIKKIVREFIDKERIDIKPSVKRAINFITGDMINRIQSNDLNLSFSADDIQPVIDNFQNKINHYFSDEEVKGILEGVTIKLKKLGYNIK
jgi:hypothetical protein